jgi:hypothetical protein
MKVLFGDMEFGSFATGKTSSPVCIVQNVQAVMDLPNEDAADAMLARYDSYVIPELTRCEIVYRPGAWNTISEGGQL